MSVLIHRLERNIIKIAKQSSPECIGDPVHIEQEKNRFINFYKHRNNNKKWFYVYFVNSLDFREESNALFKNFFWPKDI